jgi:peroxiredoxin Q/BCP
MRNIKKLIIIGLILACMRPVSAQNPAGFQLNSVTDNSHFVSEDAKGKYVALHFLLKTECPYCLRHTQEYFSNAAKLPNVVQVFIKPDSEEEIKSWAGKLPADELVKFPIYRDPDAKLAKQFNIPFGYEFHNQVVHYPATVLLGPDGKEVYRYTGKNNSDRLSFEKLAEKVGELSK